MSRLSRPSLCSLLSALVLGLAACGEGTTTEPNDDGHEHDDAVASGAVCPPGNTLTAEFGMDFMGRYCTSCHSVNSQGAARGGAPVDHNYDTVADVRRWATDIDKHAAAGPASTNSLMPPALPRPTQPEREQLGVWLACGAP